VKRTSPWLLARFNADAGWRDLYAKAETLGVENVNGCECYKLELTVKAGLGMTSGLRVTKYYDKQSGLSHKGSDDFKGTEDRIPRAALLPHQSPEVPLEFGEMPWELLLATIGRSVMYRAPSDNRGSGWAGADYNHHRTSRLERVDFERPIRVA